MAHLVDFPSFIFSVSKIVSYILYYVLIVSGGRINPVPVTPSWLEVKVLSALLLSK